jgi:hypothetical protein
MVQYVPPVIPPYYWGGWVCYFPPKISISLLICGVVCCDESDLQVILMGGWSIGKLFNREPLPVAPSQIAGACCDEKK